MHRASWDYHSSFTTRFNLKEGYVERPLAELVSLSETALNDFICRSVAARCSPTRSYNLIKELTGDEDKARSSRWLSKLRLCFPVNFKALFDERSEKNLGRGPFQGQPNYSCCFGSREVSLWNIGTPDERELNPSSSTHGFSFYASSLETAIAIVDSFLRGWEEGGKSMVFHHDISNNGDVTVNYRFQPIGLGVPDERINLWPILPSGGRGDRIDILYNSIFEEQKRRIRDNLKRAKEERLERLRAQKRKIEKEIEEQVESPVPIHPK